MSDALPPKFSVPKRNIIDLSKTLNNNVHHDRDGGGGDGGGGGGGSSAAELLNILFNNILRTI